MWTYGNEISDFTYQPIQSFASVRVFSGTVRDIIRQAHTTIVQQPPKCISTSITKLGILGRIIDNQNDSD